MTRRSLRVPPLRLRRRRPAAADAAAAAGPPPPPTPGRAGSGDGALGVPTAEEVRRKSRGGGTGRRRSWVPGHELERLAQGSLCLSQGTADTMNSVPPSPPTRHLPLASSWGGAGLRFLRLQLGSRRTPPPPSPKTRGPPRSGTATTSRRRRGSRRRASSGKAGPGERRSGRSSCGASGRGGATSPGSGRTRRPAEPPPRIIESSGRNTPRHVRGVFLHFTPCPCPRRPPRRPTPGGGPTRRRRPGRRRPGA